jgi:6-phosphogluconolactonase
MSSDELELAVCRDAADVSRRAADLFLRLAREAGARYRVFTVALSGGSTPKGLYARLAQEPYRTEVPWDLIHVFWGDERCVPPDDADSNYKLAADALLSQVPLPETNIHRVPTDTGDCAQAAADYAQELVTFFGLEGRALPHFDLLLLGVGDDGHTASLFPGQAALDEREVLVVASPPGRLPPQVDRVTLTLPVLNAARHVVFLATGPGKREIVNRILAGVEATEGALLPAQRVRPADGMLTWIVDQAAAGEGEHAT